MGQEGLNNSAAIVFLFMDRAFGRPGLLRSFPGNRLMDLLATEELGEDSRPLTNINKNGAGSPNCTDCIMHVKAEK